MRELRLQCRRLSSSNEELKLEADARRKEVSDGTVPTSVCVFAAGEPHRPVSCSLRWDMPYMPPRQDLVAVALEEVQATRNHISLMQA